MYLNTIYYNFTFQQTTTRALLYGRLHAHIQHIIHTPLRYTYNTSYKTTAARGGGGGGGLSRVKRFVSKRKMILGHPY